MSIKEKKEKKGKGAIFECKREIDGYGERGRERERERERKMLVRGKKCSRDERGKKFLMDRFSHHKKEIKKNKATIIQVRGGGK